MYNDDYDLHNAQFVDHLNNGGSDVRLILIGLIRNK